MRKMEEVDKKNKEKEKQMIGNKNAERREELFLSAGGGARSRYCVNMGLRSYLLPLSFLSRWVVFMCGHFGVSM